MSTKVLVISLFSALVFEASPLLCRLASPVTVHGQHTYYSSVGYGAQMEPKSGNKELLLRQVL